MKPVLHSLHSPDVDLGLLPTVAAENVWFLVQALIGADTGVGSETFDFIVCTPESLATEARRDKSVGGRGYLVAASPTEESIAASVRELCEGVERPSWAEVAAQLNRYMWWEFDDYKQKPQ